MATGTLVSLEEFERLPDEPGKQELSDGELVITPLPKFIHTKVSHRLYQALAPSARSNPTAFQAVRFQPPDPRENRRDDGIQA
jgi:Uma2 family endonuclease